MNKEIYNKLSQLDKIEYLLRKKDEDYTFDDIPVWMMISIFISCSVLAYLTKDYNFLRTITKIIVYGIVIYLFAFLFVVIIYTYKSIVLDREFTKRVLECKQKS